MTGGHRSARDHEDRWFIADDCDVPLAWRGVFYAHHVTGTELPRLTIRRGYRQHALRDYDKLDRWSWMVQTVLQVVSAPARVGSEEEGARGRTIAADVDRSRGRRKAPLREFDRNVLEVCFCVRCAVDSRVGEAGRI